MSTYFLLSILGCLLAGTSGVFQTYLPLQRNGGKTCHCIALYDKIGTVCRCDPDTAHNQASTETRDFKCSRKYDNECNRYLGYGTDGCPEQHICCYDDCFPISLV